MSTTITVMTEDIQRGDRGKAGSCAVAHAFMRQMGLGQVMVTYVCVWDCHTPRGWGLPPAASKFMRRFDDGLDVAPLTFEVEDPYRFSPHQKRVKA